VVRAFTLAGNGVGRHATRARAGRVAHQP
jgi:hypothetical protein